jgi:CubicO group peptidase (beta-lactamase class C family)
MKFNIVRRAINVILSIAICVAQCNSIVSANEIFDAVGNEQKKTEVEKYFNRLVELGALKGVAVSVIHKQHTMFELVAGIQSSDGQPLTIDTAMAIGSVSKAFVAAIVMRLASENLLNIEQPISEFIPTLSLGNPFNDKPVLVKHLLQHRSGITALIGNRNQASVDTSSIALATAAMSYSGAELAFPPGEKFIYSNANYQLLAYIIEIVTKQPYESILHKFIFTPLKMEHSFASRDNIPGIDIASGFQKSMWGYKTKNTQHSRVTLPQEGLYSSLTDMSVFLKAILNNDEAISIGAASDIYQSKGELRVDYQYGWFIREYHKQKLVFHFGQSPGFESVVAFFPELDLGFVVLTNTQSAYGQTNVTDAIGNLLPILFDQPLNPNTPNIIDKSIFYILNCGLMVLLFWAAVLIRKVIGRTPKKSNDTSISKDVFVLVNLALLMLIYILLIVLKLYEPNLYWTIIVASTITILVLAARSYCFYEARRNTE